MAKYNLTKEGMTNYTIHKVGVWHKKEILKFANLGAASNIVENDNDISLNCEIEIIETNTIDNIFKTTIKEDLPTYIKMDIEGAELNALKGAKNIIQKNKPKLAISIYHKPEDIMELLIFIKELVPEYKFYLRHYSHNFNDTLLYAVTD